MMISSLAQSPRLNSANNSVQSKNTPTAFKGFLVVSQYFTNNRPLQMVAVMALKGDKVEVSHSIKGADKHFRKLAKALLAKDKAAIPSISLEGPFDCQMEAFLKKAAALSKKVSRKNDIKEIKLHEDFLRRNIFTVLEKKPNGIESFTKRIIGANPDNTIKYKQSEPWLSAQEKFIIECQLDDDRMLKIKQLIMYVPDEEIDKIKKGERWAKFEELWTAK